MDSHEEEKVQLIVVFKREVEQERASKFLDETRVCYHEGMDSSRGKLYFYRTGPKFILTFETGQAREQFRSIYENREEIYEIYHPDWSMCKD